jgi:ketosteroid isomerase-like protein
MANEEFVRQAHAIAEVKDIDAWVGCFNPDGVFVDESVGVTYRGPSEVGKPVENYGTAFSNMHRELYDVYVSGHVVVVASWRCRGRTTGRSRCRRGSFRRPATEWTRRAATSSVWRTAGSSCSTVTPQEP